MLTNEQIVILWENFNPPGWTKWQKDYLDFITWARDVPEAELRTEGAQKKLWNARVITPAGYGDAVNVSALLAEREFVDSIIGLRTQAWPSDIVQRAAALQGEYERLIAIAVARGVKPRPYAKLKRLLGALVPRELTCVLSYDASRHAAELLLGDARDLGIDGQVRMRARLRDALGEEKDLAEHVRRSTFCWWLHDNHARLMAGKMPPWGKDEPAVNNPPTTGAETIEESPPLVLWPFAKQFKGNPTTRGFVDAYRAVVQAALPGLRRDDLVEVLQSSGGFEELAPSSLRALIIRIKGLGLLEERDELLYATPDGDRLLGEDLPDILVLRFIERVFGFAQFLRHLHQHPGSPDQDIVKALQEVYPSWKSDWPIHAIRSWINHLGLIRQDEDDAWHLTEYGAAWAFRLPSVLPIPSDEVIDDEPTSVVTRPPPIPYPEFADILAHFKSDPEIADFVFQDRQLATLHAAWRSNPKKRFVLLSGLSGTGKTAVTLCYARAVCALMGIPEAQHREIVPVSPDWRDPSGLLGYFNALHADPTFQAEAALRLVLRAAADPGGPTSSSSTR